MAIDAKAIVQQNKVLIALYVVAIVPIILWVVLVLNGIEGDMTPPPKGAKPSFDKAVRMLNDQKTTLNGYVNRIKTMKAEAKDHKPLSSPVYTPRHTTEYVKRNDELKKQFEEMSNLIKGRQQKLDSWFPDQKIQDEIKQQKEPTIGNFKSVFDNEISRLQKDYADLVFDNPTSATKTCFLWQETPAPGSLKLMQKKFWIQEQILIALKKCSGDHGVEQLLDKIDFGQVSASSAPGDKNPHFLTAIPVKIIYKGTFRDIPKVVRELLAQDISYRLTRLHVELLPFSISKGEKDGFDAVPPFKINTDSPKGLYEKPIYDGKLLTKDKVPGDEEQILPEPRLRITIELDALNFETDAIAAAANPAAEAPAATPQAQEPPPPPKKKKPKKEDE